MDIGTTLYGIRRDSKVEGNLALVYFTKGSPRKIPLFVIGATVLTDLCTHEIAKSRPKWAAVYNFGIAVVHVWATGRNLK